MANEALMPTADKKEHAKYLKTEFIIIYHHLIRLCTTFVPVLHHPYLFVKNFFLNELPYGKITYSNEIIVLTLGLT